MTTNKKTPSQFNNEFKLTGNIDVLLSQKVFDCTKGCRMAVEIEGYNQPMNMPITTKATFKFKTNFDMIQLFQTMKENKGFEWQNIAISLLGATVVVLGYKLK
jgi:hypothetical protein